MKRSIFTMIYCAASPSTSTKHWKRTFSVSRTALTPSVSSALWYSEIFWIGCISRSSRSPKLLNMGFSLKQKIVQFPSANLSGSTNICWISTSLLTDMMLFGYDVWSWSDGNSWIKRMTRLPQHLFFGLINGCQVHRLSSDISRQRMDISGTPRTEGLVHPNKKADARTIFPSLLIFFWVFWMQLWLRATAIHPVVSCMRLMTMRLVTFTTTKRNRRETRARWSWRDSMREWEEGAVH